MTEVFEIGRIVGSYRIIRPLGSGGMGVVYEVEHLKLKTRRALKVFDAENENAELHRKRFLIEGKMLSALDHPRVVRVHEFDVDPATARPYFVMDLVLSPDGTPRTLEDERRAGVDEEKSAKWFSDVCEGLDYVHSLGIVHRDVKLENILISPDGRAVLSDFGISRIFDDGLRERLDVTVTMPQDDRVLRVLGSAYYMAPELLGPDAAKATPASDAWALGVMMYRLLSGIWFERESRANCLDVLNDCDLPWRALIDRLCSEDTSLRHPQAGFASLAASLTPASSVPKRNHGWLWAGAVALMAVVGLGAYFAVSTESQVPSESDNPSESVTPNTAENQSDPFLGISVDFDDLKLMNGGEPVLIPGIAAETKRLSLAWDEATVTNTLAKTQQGGDPISALLQVGQPYKAENVRGILVKINDPNTIKVKGQELSTSPEFFRELSITNLASVLVHLEPAMDFSDSSNICLTAELKYVSPANGKGAAAWLRGIGDGIAASLVTNSVEETNGTVRIAVTFKRQDGPKIANQIVMKALGFDQKGESSSSEIHSRSRSADSDGAVIEIPKIIQDEIRDAEAAYLRRQLYDPVVKALQGEPAEVQEKWRGVLTTAEILLDYVGGDIFETRREFVGIGAVNAYTNGCRYPVPIAYAFASKTKRITRIQEAYSNLYVNIERDTRWNAASRLKFFSHMSLVDRVMDEDLSNAPPSLTNACHEAHVKAMREFLVEKDYSPNEIGMVYHFASFCCGRVDLGKVLDDIRDDGIDLDPWLELMLRATAARNKAWKARGDGYANTVTPEGWRIYEEELAKAMPLLEKAYHLRPEQPWSCRLALRCSYDDGFARELWLKRLLACNQGLARGLNFYLRALRPRWGGSNQKMVDFLTGLAQKQQFDTMIPIFAYERIVSDVFASEGGLSLKGGEFPNVDKYILSLRGLFSPYFEGYRKSRLEERLPFIRKVHLYIALADLAWRLEDEKELLYWSDRFKSLGIPSGETHFPKGYWKYSPYLGSLRKLEGTKRHDFLAGLHALDIDGNPEAIDKMRKIAEEVGETRLAFESVLARKGKVDLRPFIKDIPGGTRSGAKQLSLDFGGHQRDHMIFRFKLRSGMNHSLTRFHLDLIHDSNWLDTSKVDDHISVGGWRGEMRPGWVEWPIDEDICSFEFEIVGSETRLTKNGVRLMEKSISALPSLCRLFSVSGFFGYEISILKLELEVLDGMDFVIPSEPRAPVVPKQAVSEEKIPSSLKNNKKSRMPTIGGAECVLSLDGRDINEWGMYKTRPVSEGDEVCAVTDDWSTYFCPLRKIEDVKDACTVVFECGAMLKPFPQRDFVLGSFDLSKVTWGSNQDRVMVVVNPGTGDVYAVAQGNVNKWKGIGRFDMKAFPCALAFAYDYDHGLVAYQRLKNGSWVTLVSCNRCRYRGETPKGFRFGGCSRPGLPFKHLVGLTFRTVSVYPKVLSLDEMNELPNPISPSNPKLTTTDEK